VRNYCSSIRQGDEVAILAAGGGHILIIGSPGTGQLMLVQ